MSRHRINPGRVALSDIVREAVASVSGRPGRSLLTLASTLIGIASLVALIGISQTAAGQIDVGFSLLQTTLVTVRMDPEQMTDADPMGFPVDGADAVTALNGVQAASLYWQLDADALDLDVRTSTSTQNLADSLAVYAADAGVNELASSVRADGIGFTDFLVTSGARTAILGERAADKLGVDDLRLPAALSINGEHFTVIGVLGTSEAVPQLNTAIIIPSQTALDRFGQPTTQHPAQMTVRTDVGAADLIARQVRYALRPDAPSLFTVTAPQDWSRATDGVEDSVSGLLLAVAVVILVISALAIGTATLSSVNERAAEIGLRRALGARSRHIHLQVVIEAALLGGLGALTGESVGVLVVVAVSALHDWTPVMTPVLLGAGPLLGVAAGAVGGLMAARAVSRLETVDALRRS
ncbi:ABC transporter permease [Actinomyces qiguomingii]|uniref:ABC transporter permease n=1 Tax=Actinomyces qiguomingii TaxID=2057800 RepID=UPI000CA00DF9|nr:ABC transporter permease [Actinomyces qiguomingii]